MKSFPIVYACIVILMILATLIIRTKIKSDKIAILAQHSSVPWCHHAATDREEPSLDCRQLYLDPEGEIASFREFRLWCKGCQEHYQSARWESLSSGPAVGNRSMEIASQKIQAARACSSNQLDQETRIYVLLEEQVHTFNISILEILL